MRNDLLRTGVIALACCGLALAPAFSRGGSTDAIFIEQAPANDAPNYESNYAAEARIRSASANTPEADARPGEYYFQLGARAFHGRDFAHAVEMYQVAASWAYKPAEYNLGVMYARGQGVAVDLPRAMAWMALAAERDEPHYVDAREAVYAELTREQFAQANEIWRELKKTYGDDVALRRAKARWAEVKSQMTGSRVGSVGHLEVGSPNANGGDASMAKPANEAMKKKLVAQGQHVVRSTATSPGEATGGEGIDGSIAYKQLRESDNPYDPKFEQSALGKATVGPPQTLKPGTPSRDDAADAQPDPAQHDHDR